MLLEWWNAIVRWFNSDAGSSVVSGVILPFIAILAAGLTAGLIMRSSMKRFVAHQDRQAKASAVAALIASGRRAAVWNALSAQEKEHVEHQLSEAEVRVRLLPVSGAALAADWAAHHLADMKRNSASYSYQAEQDLSDLQEGLIAWQSKPARAKKLFAEDLTAWKYESSFPEDDLAAKQREWAAAHEPTMSGARADA
ncbi:MAG: hypothetical protein ACKVOG_05735 [Rhodoglobus sp.]